METGSHVDQRCSTDRPLGHRSRPRGPGGGHAVGQLAGGVAHDFNNLLQVILGNASLCLAEHLPEPVRASLSEIREAGKRAATLVGQLLTFSRHVGTPKTVDLADLVARLLPLLRRLLGEHIVIDVQRLGDGWQVSGDASQLEQIIVNLCVNARDATQPALRVVRSLRILLAEDDAAVLEVTRQFLIQAGHEVVVAKRGDQAMDLIAAQGPPFDLLILDAIMPGANGPEVFRHFRSGSSAPVLFVTGHDFDVLASLPANSQWSTLRKPFESDALVSAIAKLIER